MGCPPIVHVQPPRDEASSTRNPDSRSAVIAGLESQSGDHGRIACQLCVALGDFSSMGGISLYLSYDRELDWLMVYEFGRVDDYHLPGAWRGVSESFGYMLSEPGGEEVGLKVLGFSEFDANGEAVAEIWTGPQFDVPALGLRDVSAGEIVTAAVPFLDGESTVNRRLFHQARDASDEVAVASWRDCLQSGDPMANYGLGYTLFRLGRHHEAYRHLRAYTEIVPANPWAWCWLGRACHALGETAEARSCYERALEFEDDDEATDAAQLLSMLDAGHPAQFEDEEARADRFIRETPFDSATYLDGLEVPETEQDDSLRPVALFLAGGPLSGKTTVVESLLGAPDSIVPVDPVLVDPSEIRTELPEWAPLYESRDPRAADAVEIESRHIALKLVVAAVQERRDLIIDGLGAGEPGQFAARLKALHDAGYDVRVLLVDTPTDTALERNEERALHTGLRIDPDRVRSLHAVVSQRFGEWHELPWLRWEMYHTG